MTLQRRTPLRRQSRKAVARARIYRRRRDVFLDANPSCARCGRRATEVHHKRGRGKYLLDEETWLALCHGCHMHVTTRPAEALADGWSLPRIGGGS